MYASDYGFDVKPIAFFLNKRFAWRTVVSQPLKVSVKDFDGKRAEMNADLLVEQLENAAREYGVPSRPFVVIGYTSLPMFSPSSPASPYIYMRHSALGQGGIAVISTTHLTAAANTVMQQRLMKITLRAIGLYVLHRKLTFDDWSVMHLPLDSAADLDLMRPVFDHAPHTAIVNP